MLQELIQQIDKFSTKVLVNKFNLDADKPHICIVSAENNLSTTHCHLDQIATHVQHGVVASGGVASIVNLFAIDSSMMSGCNVDKFDLPNRDIVTNNIEMLANSQLYDAMIMVAGEANTLAGMVIGGIRSNIPFIIVSAGVMSPMSYNEEQYGIFDMYSMIGKLKYGKINNEQLQDLANITPTIGGFDCNRYGHASFACTIEAMGLSVLGSSTVPALSSEQFALARQAGVNVVDMAKNNFTPKRLLTSNALLNAINVDLACGGSCTTMINIIAIAHELSLKTINLKVIEDLSKSTPLLLDGSKGLLMQQFHNAGGVKAIIKQLIDAKIFKADAYTHNNMTFGSCLNDYTVAKDNVVCKSTKPVKGGTMLRVIRGNVAPDGCYCSYTNQLSMIGTARVYSNHESAIDAIMLREIQAGDIIVIQNCGPKSGIGMPEITLALALLEGSGMASKVGVITDGRITNGYTGIAVGCITPETCDGNMFSVLQDGDEIEISVTKGKVNCDIKAKELTQRIKNLDNNYIGYSNSYLRGWSKNVNSATQGCVGKSKR